MQKAELEQFRRKLIELRSRLVGTVGKLEQAIVEDAVTPGDLSTVPLHMADIDSGGVEENVALAENEEQILEQVDAALARIEAGKYGRCEECGKPIPIERLEAIPYATMCVKCAAK